MLISAHLAGDLVGPGKHHLLVWFGRSCGVGDDERRFGLVDEDTVGLVDDRVMKLTLHARVHLGGSGTR